MSSSIVTPPDKVSPVLGERHTSVLKAVVRAYIESGVPVGSRTLVRLSGSDLSPATIRNVMAELGEMGLLSQPHTSAGRIPTDTGYRLYADDLLTTSTLSDDQQRHLHNAFARRRDDLESTLQEASQTLADLTRTACMVLLPTANHDLLRRIQFFNLSDNRQGQQRVMALLVTVSGQVQNRVFALSEGFSQKDLDHYAHSLSCRLEGLTLAQVRDQLAEEVADGQKEYDALLGKLLETLQEAALDRMIVNGRSNLLSFPQLGQWESLSEAMSALEGKRRLVHLLNECLKAEGVRLFIGSELADGRLHHCSVVAAKFVGPHNRLHGTVGVLGPSRLDYDHIIPLVGYTARLLSSFWNDPGP